MRKTKFNKRFIKDFAHFQSLPFLHKSQCVYQLTITWSKWIIETLEQDVKYVQSQQKTQKKHQNDANYVVLVFLLLTSNIFHTFF